jgi:hypothetical protein
VNSADVSITVPTSRASVSRSPRRRASIGSRTIPYTSTTTPQA